MICNVLPNIFIFIKVIAYFPMTQNIILLALITTDSWVHFLFVFRPCLLSTPSSPTIAPTSPM